MVWTSAGKAGRAILQVATLAVLSRLVSPADFGVVSAALVVIGFSQIFSRLGLGPALVQREELDERHLKTAFTASVLFGLLVGAIVWVCSPLAAIFFRMPTVAPVLRALAWTFPLTSLAVVSESLIQRDLRFRWLASREVLSFGVGYGVVGIIAAWAGLGVWALVWANLAQVGVNTLLMVIGRPPTIGLWPDRQALRELTYYGGGFTAGRIANYFALQGDNLVVGRWLGAAALGLYGRAYQLMAMPSNLFGDVLDNVLFPALARKQGNPEQLGTAYARGCALIALVVLPVSVVLVVLAPEVIHVVLGPKWTGVVVPFQILAAGMLFRTSYKMSDSLSRATGAVYRRAWRQGLNAALVIGGAWVGRFWGVPGVAAAVLLALATNYLMMAQLSLTVCRMSWGRFLGAQAPAAALALAGGVTSWALITVLRGGHLPSVVRLIAVGSVVLIGSGLLVWRLPRVFLGEEGLWMLQTAQGYLQREPAGAAIGKSHAGR
jgi:PST family polysaccharide transporter